MEEELRCSICKQLFVNPVLLPCYHSLCLSCAVEIQIPSTTNNLSGSCSGNSNGIPTQIHSSQIIQSISNSSAILSNSIIHHHQQSITSSGSSGSSSAPESVSSDQDQTDKVSILSETDSGVVCCNSRPDSFAGTPNLQGLLFPPSGGCSFFSLPCPICRKIVFFDEAGARNLQPYRAMELIIDRFCEREALRCQMCESEPPKVATVACEQCDIRYCDGCRELCHPVRGPLAKHNLIKPREPTQLRDSQCVEHSELMTMYCLTCKLSICQLCLNDNRHQSHEVQPISTMCRNQKTELSHNLQQLSEKARSTTEFIQRLKVMSDKVTDSCIDFEKIVTAQFEELIEAIRNKREHLMEAIRRDKDIKLKILKEQQTSCTSKLQQTTGLIQFCIEALKETDNAAFLQVGSMLISRVANTYMTWHQEVKNAAPRVSPIANLTLDDLPVIRAIDNLNFIQMKLPLTPHLIPEDCSAENNSVTVAWKTPILSYVEGHILELDDGSGGDFREVYCGKETMCTVDGLHFNSLYNARVKSFNSNGEGEYSDMIGLQTAEVAWFTFDPQLSSSVLSNLNFSNENLTVSAAGWDHSVALGSVGFSRGIHYWEFTVDKYTGDTDPAFGVARIDVSRDIMLGKDEHGFSMYIDRQRSWFQHNSIHERRVEGGIATGSTIGVLLDLERHTLSFLVNAMPHGSVAFKDLYGVFYPAVSINRGVKLTLHSALDAPKIDYNFL